MTQEALLCVYAPLMRALNFPARVLLVALTAILPFALLCGIALQALLEGQRAQIQASTLSLARALTAAVEGELRNTVASLEALALTGPLGGEDITGAADAYALASAVRNSHPEWRAVLLAAPDGAIVFDTESPFGAARGAVLDQVSLAEVVRTQRPVIGQLTAGRRGNVAFAVRVPVLREGVVRRVLTAVVKPEAIAAVLSHQQVPAGWAVSVFDGNRIRVARSINDERDRGSQPSESMRTLLDRLEAGSEITGTTRNIDGIPVQAAVVRLQSAPWLVVLGAATSMVDGALHRSLLAYGGGLLLSLVVSVIAAWWMSRALTRPMAHLRAGAAALGSGLPVAINRSGIAEVDAVADALVEAASGRAQHEREREQLLEAERQARANAERAERRLERLVSASAMLSRSLEEASTLEAIATVVVPDIADICRIDLLDENDMLQRKLTRHVDPARGEAIAQLVEDRTAPADAPGSFPWAVATGQTFVLNLSDPELPELLDPGLRDFARALNLSAGCIVPLVARGRTIGAMGILQGESGRRFGPDDVALIGELAQRAALALDNVRLLSQARSAQLEAEVASKAKDEFLAMLGHELRNPLAPISLALQLIARRDANAFPRERLIIERQVKHLSRLVDDLLDVSRIVSGKIDLKFEQVDLCDVVRQALELTLPAMQQRKTLPIVSLPSEPVMVLGEAVRLTQIVGNLLTNAAKFTEPSRSISLCLRTHASWAEIEVVDEGCGIHADLIPHIFDQFVQARQQLQRAAGGLGLGLAIARSLTRLHGGTIHAQSLGLGHGATFTLRIPLPAKSDAEAVAADAPGHDAEASRPLTILLVDDNLDALEVLADCLRMEQCRVHTAQSGEEALDLLERESVDAAIFDIGLPGMTGYELARRVRADPRSARVALIALTGYGQETDKQHATEAGFDAHYSKPAPLDSMLRDMHRTVGLRSRTVLHRSGDA